MGEIQYTVTDQTIGMVNAIYYPNPDVSTVRFSAFLSKLPGGEENSPDLLAAVNGWLAKRSNQFANIARQIFHQPALIPDCYQQ